MTDIETLEAAIASLPLSDEQQDVLHAALEIAERSESGEMSGHWFEGVVATAEAILRDATATLVRAA